jgi:hypothetical protein
VNSTSDHYRMNPAEDTLVYGDELAEGMWVLPESPLARLPHGGDEDSRLRAQRFRRVTRLRRRPYQDSMVSEVTVFVGEWVDGYRQEHLYGIGQAWIVKKAPADPQAVAEAEVIARICASGYNEHVRLHGPDGDRAGTPAGGSFTIVRGGRAYTVTVTPAGMTAEGKG